MAGIGVFELLILVVLGLLFGSPRVIAFLAVAFVRQSQSKGKSPKKKK
jgi:hypothetical protein